MENTKPNIPPDPLFNRTKNRLLKYITDKMEDAHLKELLKGSSIFIVFKFFGLITAYTFTLLITRNLGADAMGIFALSFTVLQITSALGRLGLDTALIRFVAEYSSQGRKDLVKEIYLKTVKIVIPFGIFLSVLMFFSSPYLAKYIFNKEHLSEYFRIASFAILPMVLVFINSGSLRGLKKIKEFSFLHNVSIYLFAIIILALFLLSTKGEHIPLISYVLAVAIVCVLSTILWLRSSKLTSLPDQDSIKLRDLLNVSMPMLLSGLLFFIMAWTDTIMLGMFRTEGEVGVYNIAFRVASLISITMFAINSIAAPKFAEFYGKGDMKGLGRIAQQSTKLIFWTSLPVLLIILLFPSFILGLFGEEFKTGIYALLFLAFGKFIYAIMGSSAFILQMTGRQKALQHIVLITTAMNIVLNAVLIPKYGIRGAAFASMISIFFWNLSAVLFVKYSLNFSIIYFPFKKMKA